MDPRDLVEYQKWANRGYISPLVCSNDSNHPQLIPDVDNPKLGLRCIMCSFHKEIGLQEQQTLMTRLNLVRSLRRN